MVNKKNLRSEWLISDEFNNQRIDYFLKKKIPNLNFPTLCTLLRKGIVKINNKKVKNSYVLNKGDHIISSFSYVKPLLKNKISIKKKLFFESLIIFKNQNYYIINKPSGLAVQGGTKVNFNLDMVLESLKSDALDKPKLVHRIDKQTSGVLVISRNLKTAKYFGELFKSRSIEKIYITIVHGIPQNKEGIIETPLVYNDRVHQSKTKYKVLESKNNETLMLVKILTGRKHQIRKHFFEIGHPILGDKKYNITNTNHSAINNFFLHSYSIKFEDIDGSKKFFYCSPPKYFEDRIKLLGFINTLTEHSLKF